MQIGKIKLVEGKRNIYSYQRIFSTGSQTQALYSLKASYFHLLGYFDPTLILAGQNYYYTNEEVVDGDVRIASLLGFGFGFDRSNWQLSFLSSTTSVAMHVGNSFRLNYRYTWNSSWSSMFSIISNRYKLSDRISLTKFEVKSQSLSALLSYSFSKRFTSESLVSVEKFESDSMTKTQPKIGTSIHLFF